MSQDVVIVATEQDGQFLLLKRKNGYWTFPSGKVEPGETDHAAIVREILEETNLEVDVASIEFIASRTENDKNLRYFFCRARGNFVMREPDKFEYGVWMNANEIEELDNNGDEIFPPLLEKIKEYAPH